MDRIFAKGGEVSRVLPLSLNTQDHHYVRIADRVFNIVLNGQSLLYQMLEVARNKSSGTRYPHSRAEFCKQMNVRSCDAAMEDVADDRNLQAFDLLFVFANGHR